MQEQQVEYNTGFKLQHGEQKVLEMTVLVQETMKRCVQMNYNHLHTDLSDTPQIFVCASLKVFFNGDGD